MNCPACSAQIPAESKFCPQCGATTDGKPSEPPVSPTQAFKDRVTPGGDDYDPEEQLWVGGYSGKAMAGSWLSAAVVTVAGAVVCALISLGNPPLVWSVYAVAIAILWGWLGVTLAYRKLSVHYELTNQRFIHRQGILTRTTDRIEVIDMDDVTFQQGIVQRLFGIGRIQITSSDRSHPELTLRGIADVQRVAGLIDDVRRKERRRRGLHIEAI